MTLRQVIERLESIEALPTGTVDDYGRLRVNTEREREIMMLRLDIERYLLLHGGQQ